MFEMAMLVKGHQKTPKMASNFLGKASQPNNNMVDGWIQKKVDTIRKFSLGQHRSTNQMVVNQDANVWVSSREL